VLLASISDCFLMYAIISTAFFEFLSVVSLNNIYERTYYKLVGCVLLGLFWLLLFWFIYLQRFLTVFFLCSFWSSSTLPRLVCLAYVRGFYFLFCCVEVSCVVSVVLWSVVFHCVVL